MKKYRILFTALLLIAPALTYAVFQDIEISRNNTFSATTLDITFSSPGMKVFQLTPGTPYTITARLRNRGELPNINTQIYEYIRGNAQLAEKINLQVLLESTELYNGSLTTYIYSGISLPQSAVKILTYKFSISEENYNELQTFNEIRTVFFIKDIANQEGFIYPNGFNDIETLRIVIKIPAKEAEVENTEEPLNLIDTFIDQANLVGEA